MVRYADDRASSILGRTIGDDGAHDRPRPRLRGDSRAVSPGDVFVALCSGAPARRHIDEALVRGAGAVLAADDVGHPDPRVRRIPDLLIRIGALASEYTGDPSAHLAVVGVTGTNGKTSTVQLLAQAWTGLGLPAATIGTLGAGMHGSLVPTGLTTPGVVEFHELLADFRRADAAAVAVELSSHALMQGRVDGARFDVAAFTNLTRDHLDYHPSMDAYGEAKRRILELPGLSAVAMNVDDPYVAGLVPPRGLDLVGVSTRGAPHAGVRAEAVRLHPSGADFTLVVGRGRAHISSPLLGRFNVDNLTMTAAILHAQGEPIERIVDALAAVRRIPGRMQVVQPYAAGPRVVVDYAHTPDALRQALAALSPRSGDLIVVFGCTGERDRGKRPEMAAIAEAGADLVVVTDDDVHGEDGDEIVAEVLAGFRDASAVRVVRDRAQAIREAIAAAGAGDTVLIAGMGHEAVVSASGEPVGTDATLAADALRARTPAR
ncbi:Mur ligase family protein [Microbacterium radiodurans]|nr:UDP-N-acetylmuramoyl-L-alanyl-D-glutamate--2,6-diaminopimelate ligase [Microbacterium radiodurans]